MCIREWGWGLRVGHVGGSRVGVLDPPVHRVAEGKPHSGSAARAGEIVGGPGRIAAHQHLRRVAITATTGIWPPRRWQRRQRLVQHGDVIGGGVGTGATGAQQPGQRLPTGDLGAIEKRQQRVQAERLLPGRRRHLFVVGVIEDQGGIDVDMQPLPVTRGGAGDPRRGPGRCPGGVDSGKVRGVDPLDPSSSPTRPGQTDSSASFKAAHATTRATTSTKPGHTG